MSQRADVRVCADLAEASRAAIGEIAAGARGADQVRGRFTLVLPGGNTPQTLYRILAGDDGRDIPWGVIHTFWGDERCVPPDHPESNFGMAQSLLLSRVPIPKGNLHRVPAEEDPATAAALYAEEIRRFFGLGPDGWPRFDLVLLGLGEDGHTASLFPDGRTISDSRFSAAVYAPGLDACRITLTLPALMHAARILFLVSGRAKADIVRTVLEGTGDDLASRVLARRAGVTWLVDREAAGRL